jgi:hypothetical protein
VIHKISLFEIEIFTLIEIDGIFFRINTGKIWLFAGFKEVVKSMVSAKVNGVSNHDFKEGCCVI